MSSKRKEYKVPKYRKRDKYHGGRRQLTKIWIVWNYFKNNVDTARGCAEATGVDEGTVRGCINKLFDHYEIVWYSKARDPRSMVRVRTYTSNKKYFLF
jgi:hypothetical protein